MTDSQQQLRRADELITLGRHEQALALLYPMLGEGEEDQALVHFHISKAHIAGNDLEQAETHARSALALEPEDVFSLRLLAIALHGQKKYPEALKLLQEAIRLDPQDPYSHARLSYTYSELMWFTMARYEAEKAVELGPDDTSGYMALGFALFETNPEEAERAYRKVLELEPSHVDAKHNLAILAQNQGNFEKGSSGLVQVLAEAPSNKSSIMALHGLMLQIIWTATWTLFVGGFLAALLSAESPIPGFIISLLLLVFITFKTYPRLRAIHRGAGDRFLRNFFRQERRVTAWACLTVLAWLVQFGSFLLGLVFPGSKAQLFAYVALPMVAAGVVFGVKHARRLNENTNGA